MCAGYKLARIASNKAKDYLRSAWVRRVNTPVLKIKFKAFREYELRDINKAAALYTKLEEKGRYALCNNGMFKL